MAKVLQTAEGVDAVRVLSMPDFDVVPYSQRYLALAGRLGLDFSNILFLLDHLPLALTGPSHEAQRADVARLLGERRAAVSAALPDLLALHFAPLSRPGRVEVMGQCVLPFVDALLNVLTGIALEPATAKLVSRVFSQAMGVALRRELEDQAALLRKLIETRFPGESALRQGSRLALLVLGRDALSGTLACSLHHHLKRLDGAPLTSAGLDEVPTHTGVPYIDRVARDGISADVRCRLQTLEGAGPEERMRFFGAGAHVCLGRAITLDMFRAVSGHLLTLPVSARVTAYQLRKDDVFAMPETFSVAVTAAGEPHDP